MTSPLKDPTLETLLDRLHSASAAQDAVLTDYFTKRLKDGSITDLTSFDEQALSFFSDKMVALEQDKCEFCYLLCRSLRAQRVVEIGTSFGVSTIYLAAALRDNGAGPGSVIGTEIEPEKAAAARANWAEAGVEDVIDLRVGDLRDTLKTLDGPIDFVLVDIWNVALPALQLVAPHLRPGAIVATDNTKSFADGYTDYFECVNDPANRLATMTVPFDGGFELTVRV